MTKPQIALEEPWQKTITDLLDTLGIPWCHVFPLRTKHGWRTPTSGPLAKGFPDLICKKGPWWILIETKGESTRLELDQIRVLSLLADDQHTRAWVLRPTDDINEIARWLVTPANAPATYGWNHA